MSDTPESGGQAIAAVQRAADVLLLFANGERATLGVTEIAKELGYSKAVVHRILNSLRTRELVTIDDETHRYSLGPAAVGLGLTYLEGLDVREIARPTLQKLSDESGETATLSLRTGWERIYIDQVTPSREVKMEVVLGQSFPLHAGGSSKAILAFLSDEEQAEYTNLPLKKLTGSTVVDPDMLRDELADIRKRGYAMSFGERREGASSVAAPIFDHEGHAIASMSISGPLERFRLVAKQNADLVLEGTKAISIAMGWRE
jgi:IclR family acetate operon transcriptional repressor